ncbi:MAG: hypothetical protein AVDCRST_MAG15-2492, partial [uncultured Rubellimicrobium sp.]
GRAQSCGERCPCADRGWDGGGHPCRFRRGAGEHRERFPARLAQQVGRGLGGMALADEGRIDLDAPVEPCLTRWHLPQGRTRPAGRDSAAASQPHDRAHRPLGLHGIRGHSRGPEYRGVAHMGGRLSDGIVRVGQPPGAGWRYSDGGFTLPQLV